MSSIKRKTLYVISGIVLILLILFIIYSALPKKARNDNPIWGVTYTPRFAKELSLDWQKTLTSLLDDANFKYFRLAAYWDEIEPENNQYNFEELDWMINEIEKRDGKVVLALGRKNLRWPECYMPDWTNEISAEQEENELLEMIEKVITRYKDREVIYSWQIENEALFPFGECPEPNHDLLHNEIELAKSLDSRKIILTDSGELSTWLDITKYAEILGITMYRDVSNPYTGDFHWPSSPAWYSKRALLAEKRVEKVIVAEFQMEPWYNQPFIAIAPDEQAKKFDIEKVKDNIEFAKDAGFDEYYLWGAEWWYYMKNNGHEQYYEFFRKLNQ